MKQFNVRDETHQLGRELSCKTGKCLLDVVQEALSLYQDKLEPSQDDKLVNRFLQEAAEELTTKMCETLTAATVKMSRVIEEAHVSIHKVVRVEVPLVVEATAERLREAQEVLEAEQLRELEQLLAEAEAEKAALEPEPETPATFTTGGAVEPET